MPTFQTLGSSVEKSFADLLDGLDQASTPDEVWNVGSKSHGRWATLAAHAIDQRYLTLVEPPSRRPQLSPRERECLAWLAVGMRHDRIAERLGISRPTVELHLANARRKLNARTREQALARAVAFGLLEL